MYKIYIKQWSGRIGYFHKILLLMRLTTVLLIATIVQVSAASYAQRISLKESNTSIEKVFSKIRRQTGYDFLINRNLLKNAKPVTLDLNDVSIDQALKECFEGQPFTFTVRDKTIILMPKPAGLIGNVANNYAMNQVKGWVADESGKPLPGVSVKVKNGAGGTVTDSDGKFVINTSIDAVLVFSYIGYESLEIKVGDQTDIQIKLKAAVSALDEIVVVSYGKQRNKEITGSIAQVDASTLSDMPVGQFAQQLQGKVAGVQIAQSSGQPGRGMSFRIRGAASLFAGSQPLFVVDGMPLTGGINNINPSEIETFTVLKDASATALYGSRAANGVILITTKHAKEGDSYVEFNSFYGIQKIPENKLPKMMNARQFAEYMKTRYEDQLKYEPLTNPKLDPVYANPEQYGVGTNWFDVITTSAPTQSYDITLSSGREKSSSTVVAGYQDQQGVLINTGTKLFSLRLNQELSILNNKMKLGFNVAPSYRIDHNNRLDTDGLSGIFMWALESSPLVAPVNPDGSYPVNVNSPGMVQNVNPYTRLKLINDYYKTTRILGNAYLNYEFLSGLSLKTNIGIDKASESRNQFAPSTVSTTAMALGASSSVDNYSWTAETNLQYNKSFKDHNLEILVGYSAQRYKTESNYLAGQGFPGDNIPYLNAATVITSGGSNASEFSLLSSIGRINYNYKGKYLLSGAIRRDGSSRFGENKKYGGFPSVSVGWIISDEKFMKAFSAINLLKVRSSYGITGNNDIGNYTYLSTIGGNLNYFANGTLYPGATINALGNADLAWERNKQFNIGLDLSILNNRISIVYDYYNKTTDGMIQNRPLPRSSGFSVIKYNTGVFKFWGHELGINSTNLVGTLKWNTNFNLSFDRNQIKSLVSPGYIDAANNTTANYYRNQVGHPLGLFYGFVFEGLYEDAQDFANSPKYGALSDVGTVKMRDINGDGVVENVNDRTFIGDPTPDFIFGLTNNFSYKNFDLNISIAGSIGGELLNVTKWTHLVNMDGSRNLLADAANRWRSLEDPGSGIYPRTKTGTTALGRYVNSLFVENGSYLTVKNVSLGYSIPLRDSFVAKKIRLFGSVQQALVWSAYSGMNPESNLSGLDATQGIGVDANAYPVPRTFSLGVSVVFK